MRQHLHAKHPSRGGDAQYTSIVKVWALVCLSNMKEMAYTRHGLVMPYNNRRTATAKKLLPARKALVPTKYLRQQTMAVSTERQYCPTTQHVQDQEAQHPRHKVLQRVPHQVAHPIRRRLHAHDELLLLALHFALLHHTQCLQPGDGGEPQRDVQADQAGRQELSVAGLRLG